MSKKTDGSGNVILSERVCEDSIAMLQAYVYGDGAFAHKARRVEYC